MYQRLNGQEENSDDQIVIKTSVIKNKNPYDSDDEQNS